MSLPGPPPPLNKAVFLVADVALLGAAWLIARDSAHPLRSTAMLGIVVCVLAAAFVGAFPFVLDYTRRQEAALDDRQRSLEALARTVATSAEQVGIAAGGLQEIAQLAEKNLKAAQELPARLADKLAELEAKLDAARDDEHEELERELASLRASESERLAGTVEKIARAAADWSKAESAGLRHVVAAKTFIAELEQKIASLRSVATAPAAVAPPSAPASPKPPRRAAPKPTEPSEPPAAPPEAPVLFVSSPSPDAPLEPHAAAPALPTAGSSSAESETGPAVTPSEPVAVAAAEVPSGEATLAPSADPDAAQAAPRKRPARQAPLVEPSLGLDDDALRSAAPGPVASRSPDGATRLLVTAYIGIGNRLFIRGDGPGLSWDEGVPLQFVSIGKWRWETQAATSPVQFKIYKNDRDLCALPTEEIEAGQQQELTASF